MFYLFIYFNLLANEGITVSKLPCNNYNGRKMNDSLWHQIKLMFDQMDGLLKSDKKGQKYQ